MTFFVGFWFSKSAVIRACSNFSNISVKWNNIDCCHAQITHNYKLSAILALFWKKSNNLQKINDSVGYEMQCFFTSSNSFKVYIKRNFRQQFYCPPWKCVKRQNKRRLPFVNNLSISKVMTVWSSQNQMKNWQEIEQRSIRIDKILWHHNVCM